MCKDDDDTNVAVGTFLKPVQHDDIIAYAPGMAEHYGWQSWRAYGFGHIIVVMKEDEQWIVS